MTLPFLTQQITGYLLSAIGQSCMTVLHEHLLLIIAVLFKI